VGQDARVQVTTTIAETRAVLDAARRDGRTVGLFPTMGYLHEGHASLMRRARDECDVVVVSIFVNPLQFAAGEDLATYPRDFARDSALAESIGVDVVFAPSVEEMYPVPAITSVSVAELAATMEGASRPTHFAGVATVVAKLFNIAGPCRAYFSEKDFQQLTIVQRMALDLSFPVEVVACPFVREPDGLAMSSRNVYLTPEERAAAPVLLRALQAGVAAILAGERDPDVVADLVAEMITAEPWAELDYVEVVDAASLTRPDVLAGEIRLLTAARFGRPRLLDNLGVLVPEQG
jgi:pantoate--beta-alanine ligase